MNQSDLKVGSKVHYVPFKGCNQDDYENGMVKSIPDHTNSYVFVVYHCNNDWDNFGNYTAALTRIEDLREGWN